MLPEEIVALASLRLNDKDVQEAKNSLAVDEEYPVKFTVNVEGRVKVGSSYNLELIYKPRLETLLYLLCDKRVTEVKLQKLIKTCQRVEKNMSKEEKDVIELNLKNASKKVQSPELRNCSGKTTSKVNHSVNSGVTNAAESTY